MESDSNAPFAIYFWDFNKTFDDPSDLESCWIFALASAANDLGFFADLIGSININEPDIIKYYSYRYTLRCGISHAREVFKLLFKPPPEIKGFVDKELEQDDIKNKVDGLRNIWDTWGNELMELRNITFHYLPQSKAELGSLSDTFKLCQNEIAESIIGKEAVRNVFVDLAYDKYLDKLFHIGWEQTWIKVLDDLMDIINKVYINWVDEILKKKGCKIMKRDL